MYRLTKYQFDEKTVDEIKDEDVLRVEVDTALDDVEAKRIKTFSVSWIYHKSGERPFWKDE